MKNPKITTHGGITLDLSRIKSFHIDTWSPNNRSHILRIEFNNRYDFVFNPETEAYEKMLVQDYLEHPYADYSTVEVYRDEWEGIWQDYLNDENNAPNQKFLNKS